MIFVTGDTHGGFFRFSGSEFPEQERMTRDDYVIICGDFGGVWFGDERDDEDLDKLAKLPFTIVFVSGNHENFDALAKYPVVEWKGGKVQFIRPNIVHLLRGQIVTIQGLKFFGMGGAASHDISDGVLDPCAPDFEEQFWLMRRNRAMFRVNHLSWWKEEMPSEKEYAEAQKNLDACGRKVDYIITHCAPNRVVKKLNPDYTFDRLTTFLETVRQKAKFHYWLFAHYHDNKIIDERFVLLWEQIVQII